IVAAYVILMACPVSALTKQYRTYVDPGPAETMQDPCEFELTLRDASKPVKAVFVVVERGWQVGNLYFDPEVTAFAERRDVALVLARHCRSKTENDMDIIPEHGIGRALLEALNQFALQSKHPELAGSKLILFSFFRRRLFRGTMVAYASERIFAAIEYAPGTTNPLASILWSCRTRRFQFLSSSSPTVRTTDVVPGVHTHTLRS